MRVDDDDIDIRSRWGVLFQGGALFSTLTVAKTSKCRCANSIPRSSDELRHEIARYKVMLSGLPADAASKYPSELSGGMRKRAGLARALALDPELLFLDEPTAGLDPIGAAAFDRLTKELQETLGLTVFLITHDLDTLYEICDRVAVIAEKKVIAGGHDSRTAGARPSVDPGIFQRPARAAGVSTIQLSGAHKGAPAIRVSLSRTRARPALKGCRSFRPSAPALARSCQTRRCC
jgi:ABC-type transporter Mla maintaining outer membrane lipid asymmetry ATPase subunit MlaF